MKKRITQAHIRIAQWLVSSVSVVITLLCFVMMRLNYPGMNIAFFIALMFTCIIFMYVLLSVLLKQKKYAKLALTLWRCYTVCLIIGFVVFLILQGFIFSGSGTDTGKVDCVIILGAGLFGEIPSKILVSRLNSALEYLSALDDSPLIIVSGGQGAGETITEAEAMYRYLCRRGIDESRIWKEDSSTNTWENISFSLSLMEKNGLDTNNMTVAIVTNEFHLFRAKYIAQRLGFDVIGVAAKTPVFRLRVLYQCREAVAILRTFLLQ